jgi:hypothetical protein
MNHPKRYTITAALPYTNGPIHIGHLAGVYVPADIYARYLRLTGQDVAFICGSDEHGVAISMKAKKEGITPQQVIDKYDGIIRKSFIDFGISFDNYSRTSAKIHHDTASEFFKTLYDKGDFIEEVTEQLYDAKANQFLADRFVVGTCPKCDNPEAYGDQCERCGSTLNATDLIHPKSTITGETPILKEFIERKVEPEDRERYQTIFAQHVGAVAAPTAGLHFTPHLLKRLELKGVAVSPITLHVGLGTFRQVDVEDLTKHKMDSENYNIPQKTVDLVNEALDSKKRVVSVGTTTLKTIESSVTANGRLKVSSGWTDKFIIPPYDFKIANALITNFHLPESTLLMTAAAFGGYDLIMKAYQEAVKEKYRFFSYGDAMLIL